MTESQIQVAIVEYLYLLEKQKKILWFTASWNWQFQKSMAVKMKMKKEGVRPGMPDIMICYHDRIIFIELKSEKWKATKYQRDVLKYINKIWFLNWIVKWHLAFSFTEAKTIIDSYL